MRFGKAGHDKFNCPSHNGGPSGRESGVIPKAKHCQIRLVHVVDNMYKKLAVTQGGLKLISTLEANKGIIRREMFDSLGADMKVDTSTVVLQGCGGGTCTVKDER